MRVGDRTKVWHPELSVILDCVIGSDCTVHAPVWIGNNVRIGDGCSVQAFSFIPSGVTIGNDVFIGPHVCFTNDLRPPSPEAQWLPTVVESDVSIGAGAVILPGITIHRGAKIGAGAVVTRSVPYEATVKGNPAR